MKHLMLDLETMSTDPKAAIVQIGAVDFSMGADKVGPGLKVNVSLSSSMGYGGVVDGDTVMWWLGQSKLAQDSLLAKREELPSALSQLELYCKQHKVEYVWGNGLGFDCVIARSAFFACRMRPPWHYRNERDMRTYRALAQSLIGARADDCLALLEPPKVEHDALEDCLFQVRQMQALATELLAVTKR